MVLGSYKQRAAGVKKQLIIAGAKSLLHGGGPSRLFTKTKHKYKPTKQRRVVRTIGHGNVPGKRKKIRSIDRKPRGVSKAFVKKVQKVEEFKKGYGMYRYIGDQQLRQGTIDLYSQFNTDRRNNGMDFFTPKRVWDSYDVLFNAKAMAHNSFNTGGTLTLNSDITVANSKATFFFKSTSSHTVNVEMYVGHYKGNPGDDDDDLKDSFGHGLDDFNNRYADHAGVLTSWTMDSLGTKADFLPSQLKHWNVVKRSFKVPPGHTHTEFIQGPRNRTYKGSRFVKDAQPGSTTDLGKFNRYINGSVNVMFRVLNDITVSKGTLQVGDVHHWPSNDQGGVAMSYEVDYKIIPLTGAEKSALAIGNWRLDPGDATDQQVTIMDPSNTIDTT